MKWLTITTFDDRLIIVGDTARRAAGRGLGMTKSELVARVAARHLHLPQRDVKRVVNAVWYSIIKSLAEGHRVELHGFGAFNVKARAARMGCNPRTGERITVAPKNTVHFRVSADLRRRMDEVCGQS